MLRSSQVTGHPKLHPSEGDPDPDSAESVPVLSAARQPAGTGSSLPVPTGAVSGDLLFGDPPVSWRGGERDFRTCGAVEPGGRQ